MRKFVLKKVTVVCQENLREDLIRDLKALGARGYTLSEAYGEGEHGLRMNFWEGRNIRLELIMSEPLCERVLAYITEHYLEKYAIIVYVENVEVVRGEKFVDEE